MDNVEDLPASQPEWQPPLFSTSTWVLIITAVVLVFVYDYWCRHLLERGGIKQFKSYPFVGNTISIFANKHGLRGYQEAVVKKHGKIAGSYFGWRPDVIISDPDIVRQICIKDFASFPNRKDIGIKNKPFDKALSTLRDGHWKDVRSILSPTFSGSKMKKMVPLVNSSLDPMIRKVTKCTSEETTLELKDLYGGYLIDSIGSCAFGLTVNSQDEENATFVAMAKDIFKTRMTLAMFIFVFLPFLTPLANYFNLTTFDRKTMNFFENILDQAVEMRKAGKEKRMDFLQMMLDVEKQEAEEEDKAEATEEEKQEAEHRRKASKKTLDMSEIKSQGLVFFLAGFETSANTLGWVSHILATRPEIQDKLIAEVDATVPRREDLTYEKVGKMTYLDWVVSETLRLYPPAVLTGREAENDFQLQGYTVPKGATISFAVWMIHRDPELWEDPEKFDPERFSPERRENRHPCAWMPFGVGPRNCIAMRFALLQVKMALIRMLQNFRFEKYPEMKDTPEMARFTTTPVDGFKVRTSARN